MAGRMNKSELEDLYINQNKNLSQIAKHFNVSVNEVRVKLGVYNIRKESHKSHGSAIFKELMEDSETDGE